jgi:hypothetical protein
VHKAIVIGTIAMLVAYSGKASLAMGGGGGSAPGASPYKILEPQTVVPLTTTHNDRKSVDPAERPPTKLAPKTPPAAPAKVGE